MSDEGTSRARGIQRSFTAAAALVLSSSWTEPELPPAPPETHTYAEVGGQALKLDLYRADEESPTPLLIWIHGGAWRGGDRAHVPAPVRELPSEGVSVASLSYRLTSQAGRFGEEPVHWPAQRDDCKAAVRWLRANAEDLGLDPERFAVWGASAGGHLASTLGLTNDAPGTTGEVGEHAEVSSAVSLAINFFGPTELFLMNQDVTEPPGSAIDHDALDSPESLVLGARVHGHSLAEIRAHAEDPEAPWPALLALARSASPVHAVVPEHAAPLFTAHGTRDRLIAFAQGERLHARLRELDLHSTWRPVRGAGHGFKDDIYREAIAWMKKRWKEEGGAALEDR